jgi:hypothetical protein
MPDTETDLQDRKAEEKDMCADKEEGKGFEMWWEERSLTQKVLLGIGFTILGIAMLAGFGLVVMLLWNGLLPDLFGWKTINYWQAWGVMILSWILFKGPSLSQSNASTERKRKRELRRIMREEQNSG